MTLNPWSSSLHVPILQTCCHPPHLVYTIMVMGPKFSHRLGNSYSSWATSLVWGIQICGWIAAHSSRKLAAPSPMSTLCILPIQQHILPQLQLSPLLPTPSSVPVLFLSPWQLRWQLTSHNWGMNHLHSRPHGFWCVGSLYCMDCGCLEKGAHVTAACSQDGQRWSPAWWNSVAHQRFPSVNATRKELPAAKCQS